MLFQSLGDDVLVLLDVYETGGVTHALNLRYVHDMYVYVTKTKRKERCNGNRNSLSRFRLSSASAPGKEFQYPLPPISYRKTIKISTKLYADKRYKKEKRGEISALLQSMLWMLLYHRSINPNPKQ